MLPTTDLGSCKEDTVENRRTASVLVLLNTKRWSFRGLSVCHCTSLRVRKHINKHPFLRHSLWDEWVYSSSTAREIAGKRRLPAQQISRWPWTGSPALGWQMEPRESNQAQQRICGEDPSLLCTPAISPLHLLTSLSSVTSKVDAWMGDSTWPRGCFLPPPHFMRRWVCVCVCLFWGGAGGGVRGETQTSEPPGQLWWGSTGITRPIPAYLHTCTDEGVEQWGKGECRRMEAGRKEKVTNEDNNIITCWGKERCLFHTFTL